VHGSQFFGVRWRGTVEARADEDADAARLAEGRRVFDLLRSELSPSRAAKMASEITGAPRKALYLTSDEP